VLGLSAARGESIHLNADIMIEWTVSTSDSSDAWGATVSTLRVVPELGGSGIANPSDSTPLFAQDIDLGTPLHVQSPSVVLRGSSGQVDFNNIGEIAASSPGSDLLPVPEAGSLLLLCAGLLGLLRAGRPPRSNSRLR
jgi:hypothetical protein